MPIKLANNASGQIATGLAPYDIGLALVAGQGAAFPSLAAGEYFYATLASAGGSIEIVKVTAKVNDTFTIVRAQEGTTALSFSAGARFELRVTAQSVRDAIDDVTASAVTFTPYTSIASTNVQSAIQEVVDEINLLSTNTFTVEVITATEAQTVFNLSNPYVVGATNLSVYMNGLRLRNVVDYVETNSTRVTLTTGAQVGDELTFVAGREVNDAIGASSVSFVPAGTGAVARSAQEKVREFVSVSDFGDPTASEVAANTAFDAAVAAISSSGLIVNPKGSQVNFETVTVPNAVLVIDMQGQRVVASKVGLGKSLGGGGEHLLIRDVRDNAATRVHQEPNGNVTGVAAKYDWMFDPYEDDGANYRIVNIYTKTYNASDTSSTQGNNGIGVLGLKSEGRHWGIWPSLHVGFSDDGAGSAVPFKVYYFDTSDTTWRTPMKGGWRSGVAITSGDYMLSAFKLYQASTSGTTGATAPTHASGSASDGGVTWDFVRDFQAAAGSVRGCVVIGDRDDLPKFGHATSRAQFSQDALFWNGKKLKFLKQDNTVGWEVWNELGTDDFYIVSADGLRALRFDATGQFMQTIGLATLSTSVTAANGDTTPSVKGAGTLIFGNTGATSVTQFDDGLANQILYVQSGNSNTTLVHGTNLKLAGGVNKTLTVDDVLLFQFNSSGTVAKQV